MRNSENRRVIHENSGRVLVERARWCDSFASRTRGFAFRRRLEPGQGLVLVYPQQSRVNTAITMFFVLFELGVLWVNREGEVVDQVLARPWRISYLPQAPALTVVEAEPHILDQVQVGDHITYHEL